MTGWPESIGILGAGALGTLLAAFLASRTDKEVWLFPRQPAGEVIAVEEEVEVAVRIASPPTKPVDLLIVLVKAYDTREALRWAGQAIGPETVALTLQNGLGNGDALAEVLGPDRVIAGTTAQGATLVRSGLVRDGGGGPTRIASWSVQGRAADVTQAAADCLSQAGIETTIAADVQGLIWSKVAVSCGINPLTALLRVPNGDILGHPAALSLLSEAVTEASAVAKATGVRLQGDLVSQTIDVARATARNRSSMLQDVERGRRTEIEAICGAVVGRGRAAGIATPVNETLLRLVLALSPAPPS